MRGEYQHGREWYCLLHLPGETKTGSEFTLIVTRKLRDGHSDFREVYFPRAHIDLFKAHQTSDTLDLRGAVFFAGALDLSNCKLGGLSIESDALDLLQLAHITVDGDVTVTLSGKLERLNMTEGTFKKSVSFAMDSCRKFAATQVTVDGAFNVSAQKSVNDFHFERCTFESDVRLQVASLGAINLEGSDLRGDLSVNANSVGLVKVASSKQGTMRIDGDVTIERLRNRDLLFSQVTLGGVNRFRGQSAKISLHQCSLKREIDFSGCEIELLSHCFEAMNYYPGSVMRFDGCTVRNKLALVGSPTLPKSVYINNCKFRESVVIRGTMSLPAVELIAKERHPEFFEDVKLTNVNLSKCRLVGSFFRGVEIKNITWASRCWRAVLYDELVVRKGTTTDVAIPYPNLRELYQELKEAYKKMGDHALSGDMHYGEMEMKRREKGRIKRFLSLEFLYWALSGYGVGYGRAFGFLLSLILAFAILYHCLDRGHFGSDFAKSLLFSLRVSSLQRPAELSNLTDAAQWAAIFQTILVPIQAALLALAIRMRMMR